MGVLHYGERGQESLFISKDCVSSANSFILEVKASLLLQFVIIKSQAVLIMHEDLNSGLIQIFC